MVSRFPPSSVLGIVDGVLALESYPFEIIAVHLWEDVVSIGSDRLLPSEVSKVGDEARLRTSPNPSSQRQKSPMEFLPVALPEQVEGWSTRIDGLRLQFLLDGYSESKFGQWERKVG